MSDQVRQRGSGRPERNPFDDGVQGWLRWRETPWGGLRYRLVEHTLAMAAERLGRRCRVLDVGGGDGGDGLPLAARGHEVTVLDNSPALLALAEERAAAEGLEHVLRTVRADLDDLATGVPAAEFGADYDMVLCHNVVQYTPDTADTVGVLARAVRKGGTISLLAPNPAMDVLAAAVRGGDPAGALALLDADAVRSQAFGRDMRRIERQEAEAALGEHGCVVTHRFGVRCVIDLMPDDERKHDERFLAELQRLELALRDQEAFQRTARFWHVLAARG
ncbi:MULTISPECIES: methyltransferase [Nocardiopsis]|uniref:Methyltransferase type 12 n=1 Tax=Nocardiopsis sinuspersici TaxID=501010 RepID=A0A1V3C9H6_9ACTN|nr:MULTISPECIES: methyltransferase [Nocardiopsis]OOC57010.1 methyltransferase type 12 [Nocardiopsis sinuspersici]